LCALLDLEEDFEVVATVGRGDELPAAAREHHPDVAHLDIAMPGLDGLAAAAVLADQLPCCRMVILTTFGRAVSPSPRTSAPFRIADSKTEYHYGGGVPRRRAMQCPQSLYETRERLTPLSRVLGSSDAAVLMPERLQRGIR